VTSLPSPRTREQLASAYRRMAGFYRPCAPSDGLGNISVPIRELDLSTECNDYATGWWTEENDGIFHIGCPGKNDRPALVYTIEAARNICGTAPATARKLLEMALTELARDGANRTGRP
jgi:hypothetical protein